jgi:hypothetical protein
LGVLAGSSGFGIASAEIMWTIRAPRVLAGFGAGAALALAGALMQLLTRNALADPYVLGVAGGASVGALGAMLVAGASAAQLSEWAVAAGAALGAAAASALLFGLLWRRLASTALTPAGEGSAALLLVGVMIGSGCSAIVSLILTIADEGQLRGMVFWLLGDLNGATHWEIVWLALAIALAMVWPRARELDWLARSDAWAATLGVRSRAGVVRCCSPRRSRPVPRSRPQARSASSAWSCRRPCAGSACVRRRCCCRRARSAAALSSSSSTRSRARSSRPCSFRSAFSPRRSASRPSSRCCCGNRALCDEQAAARGRRACAAGWRLGARAGAVRVP